MEIQEVLKLLKEAVTKAKQRGLIHEIDRLAKHEKALAKLLIFYYNIKVIEPIQRFTNILNKDMYKGIRKEFNSPLLIQRISERIGIKMSYRNAKHYAKALDLLDQIIELENYCSEIIMKYYKTKLSDLKKGKQQIL